MSYDGKFNATTVSLNLSSTSLNIAYGKKCANLDLLNLEVYPLSSEILDPNHYFTKHFQQQELSLMNVHAYYLNSIIRSNIEQNVISTIKAAVDSGKALAECVSTK